MKVVVIVFVLVVFGCCWEFLGFYPYDVETTATYRCMKDQGYDRIVIWVQSDPNGIDKQSIQNLLNANNAGLKVQINLTPCRSRSAAVEADLIIKNLGTLFTTIWIYPEASDGDCSWYEFPAEFNCMYLQQFVAQMKKYNKTVGIQGCRTYWVEVFENALGCDQVNDLDLLWVPTGQEIDRQQNFNSYKQIGGWQAPYAKLYDSKYLCGETLSLIYYK